MASLPDPDLTNAIDAFFRPRAHASFDMEYGHWIGDREFRESDVKRDDEGQFASQGGAGGGMQPLDRANMPAHLKGYRVPPAWTDVQFNPDPDAKLLVSGRDSKGRRQLIYSKAHASQAAIAKFTRIDELRQKFAVIEAQNEQAKQDPARREAADALSLVMAMGLRPGSTRDTGAEKQAYGATTLKGSHVVVRDSGYVALNFRGKKGVQINLPVRDPALAQMLIERKEKAGSYGKLFNVSDAGLRDHVDSLGGGDFHVKDFRTHVAATTALAEVSKVKRLPRTMAAYKKAVREVAKTVANRLGNTPTVALQSYIPPEVFAGWRSGLPAMAGADAEFEPYDEDDEWPEVHWGNDDEPPVDWREFPTPLDPDDEELERTPQDVIDTLGFDPLDLEFDSAIDSFFGGLDSAIDSFFGASDKTDHWKDQPRDEKGQWSETGGAGAAAKKDVPTPPKIHVGPTAGKSTVASAKGKQKQIDALHAHAQAGEWEKIAAYPVSGSNSYSKMVEKYKNDLMKLAPAKAMPEGISKHGFSESVVSAVTGMGLKPIPGEEDLGNYKTDDGLVVQLNPPTNMNMPIGSTSWTVYTPKDPADTSPGAFVITNGEGVQELTKQINQAKTKIAKYGDPIDGKAEAQAALEKLPAQGLVSIITKKGFEPAKIMPSGDIHLHNPSTDLNMTVKQGAGLAEWSLYDQSGGLLESGKGSYNFTVALQQAEKAAAPATPAAKAWPTQAPPDIKDVLPVIKPSTYMGTEAVMYTDQNNNEQVTIDKNGNWIIESEEHGVFASGYGQESLNSAFEQLHPRGPGGKFAKKYASGPLGQGFHQGLQDYADTHPGESKINEYGFAAAMVGGLDAVGFKPLFLKDGVYRTDTGIEVALEKPSDSVTPNASTKWKMSIPKKGGGHTTKSGQGPSQLHDALNVAQKQVEPVKPAVGKLTLPAGIKTMLPELKDYGTQYKDSPAETWSDPDETKQVTINEKGDWSIWQAASAPGGFKFKEGTGQESLNAALAWEYPGVESPATGVTENKKSAAQVQHLEKAGFKQSSNNKSYFIDDNGVQVYLDNVLPGQSPEDTSFEIYPPKDNTALFEPVFGEGYEDFQKAVAKAWTTASGVLPKTTTPPEATPGGSLADVNPHGYANSMLTLAGDLGMKATASSSGKPHFINDNDIHAYIYQPTDKMMPNSSSPWEVHVPKVPGDLSKGWEKKTGHGLKSFEDAIHQADFEVSFAKGITETLAKPAAAPAGKVTPPAGTKQVLPFVKDLGVPGLQVFSDAANFTESTEQVQIKSDGSWTIWKKGEGTILEGTGQESLNHAFEALHPRGPGGKFAKKYGPEEIAAAKAAVGLAEAFPTTAPAAAPAAAPKVKQSTVVQEFNASTPLPPPLNGVAFNKFTAPADWSKFEGLKPDLVEPPMKNIAGKHNSAGLLIQEPDGRVWICDPKNAYGGYQSTFPKGTIDPGETPQIAAIREAWEESGLVGEITGFAGDYESEYSNTRYYLAKRIAGSPNDFKPAETSGVKLVPPSELAKYLNKQRDKDIASAHFPPAPPQPKIGAPVDHTKMKKVGPQLGSNPGFQGEDAEGNRYYIKHSMAPERAQSEMLTAALYNAVGAPTLNYHPLVNGTGIATEWTPPDKSGGIGAMTIAEKTAAKSNFAVHAWLANWDAAGTGGDNQQIINGVPTTVDTGGGLNYRAKGELKGAAFGNTVTEWDTMRDPSKSPDAAALFKDMTKDQLQASVAKVAKITNAQINQLVNEHGPGTLAEKSALAKQLIARRDDLVKKSAALEPPAPPKWKSDPDAMRRHVATWNPSNKPVSAINTYKGHEYHQINSLLRHMEPETFAALYPNYAKYIDQIEAWIDKSSSEEDIDVFRAIGADYFKQLSHAAKPGIIVRDPGFMSIATSKSFADGWHGGSGATLRMRIPKGSKIATVRNATESDGEYEILSQKNSRFKILKWDVSSKIFEVELLPPREKLPASQADMWNG